MKSNMIKTALVLALTSLWTLSPQPAQAEKTYGMDPAHSAVLFSVQHQGVATNHGRFNDFSGKLTLDWKKPQNSSVQFTVKTASVDTGLAKRDQHLKSPDFFNSRQFPVITFKSTQVRPTSKNQADVDGKLMINGVIRVVTAKVRLTGSDGNGLVGFDADLKIKRSDFGMKFMIPMVGDDVHIRVSLEAKAG